MTSQEKTITVQMHPMKEGEVLDPSYLRFVREYYYLDNLMINLVELSSDGTYRNSLARNIKFSNEKKDLTITLKEAYFSDGKRITAHDVVQTFKRAILLGTAHSDPKKYIRGANKLKNMEDSIEGLHIISENSFFLGLNAPMKELYYFFHLTDFGILHPSQYKKKKLTVDDWRKNNSGPYLLEKEGQSYYFKSHGKSLNSHKEMPMAVYAKYYRGNNLIKALSEGKTDLGSITFKEYADNFDEFMKLKDINYYGDKSDGIIFLALNLKSAKFKDKKVRQWVNKRVQTYYKLLKEEEKYMKKANQYFLPGAKGHITNENIDLILKDINIEEVPPILKSGITIKTVLGMKNYIPHNFKERLSKVLSNIPVEIDFSMNPNNLTEELNKRTFEVYTMATSMSYKVLGESLNYVYRDKGPTFINPNGKIEKLLKDYQSTDYPEKEGEIIQEILKEMTRDSECIPIAYFTHPKFFNKKRLNIQKMYLDESFQFWHLRVK